MSWLSLVSASRGHQSPGPCGPTRGFPGQMETRSTHPLLHSPQAQSGRCCCPCESHLGTRRPCFHPPDAQMLLLQEGGWEEKQVVEGEGGGTRKREGQRVGGGASGSFSVGDSPVGLGAGTGAVPKPTPRQGVARRWEGCRLGEEADEDSPMTKTGMKAPQGTGMVVASADIQNYRQVAVETS